MTKIISVTPTTSVIDMKSEDIRNNHPPLELRYARDGAILAFEYLEISETFFELFIGSNEYNDLLTVQLPTSTTFSKQQVLIIRRELWNNKITKPRFTDSHFNLTNRDKCFSKLNRIYLYPVDKEFIFESSIFNFDKKLLKNLC